MTARWYFLTVKWRPDDIFWLSNDSEMTFLTVKWQPHDIFWLLNDRRARRGVPRIIMKFRSVPSSDRETEKNVTVRFGNKTSKMAFHFVSFHVIYIFLTPYTVIQLGQQKYSWNTANYHFLHTQILSGDYNERRMQVKTFLKRWDLMIMCNDEREIRGNNCVKKLSW